MSNSRINCSAFDLPNVSFSMPHYHNIKIFRASFSIIYSTNLGEYLFFSMEDVCACTVIDIETMVVQFCGLSLDPASVFIRP